MSERIWRTVVPIALAVLLAGGGVRAAEVTLDEPGTYIVDASTGRAVRLGSGAQAAWSPDSKTVAVAEIAAESPVSRLRLVPVSDGEARSLTIPEHGEINHLRWAPDGARLAFTLTRTGRDPGPALMVADPASGVVKQVVRGSIGEIAWTPDSLGITAMTLEEGGGAIVTFDAETGEVRESILDAKDASCQRGLAWSPDGDYLAYGGPGLREGCGDVGNWGVWTWHPATRTTRQLFQGAADAPQWLSTGAVVAMVSEPESDGVPPLSIGHFSPDGATSGSVAADVPRMFPQPPRLFQVVGDSVMYPISTCEQGEAYLWTDGQRESKRFTPADVYAYRPALAPDSRALAYVRIGEPNALVVAPLPQGAPRTLLTSTAGLQVGTAGPFDVGGDWSPDGKWIAIEVTSEQFRDCVD
jgi:dipeptidyl aminopeptidase/acylaminoacyl peptidase